MKKRWITLLLLGAMVGVGVFYGYDLFRNLNFASGLFTVGVVWYRYALMLAVVLLAFVGVTTVGPYAVGVMRLRHPALAGLFLICGLYGLLLGVYSIVAALQPLQPLALILAFLVVIFGVWMLLAAKQLARQKKPTPTKGAFLGMMGALPLCLLAGARAMSNPATLHRPLPLINVLSALVAMLWMGTMLHAMYIATVRRRAKVLYVMGMETFFLCTCLGGAQLAVTIMRGQFAGLETLQSVLLFLLGLVAAGLSLALSTGASEAERLNERPGEDNSFEAGYAERENDFYNTQSEEADEDRRLYRAQPKE